VQSEEHTVTLNRGRLLNFSQDLIRLPSLSGEEARVAQRVEAEFHALDFDEVSIDDNGSVIGLIAGAEPGPTLLLDAHIDTVGIAGGIAWSHDPFAATLVDDAIVGRGAADMKGALAAMIYGAASVDRTRLHGRFAVSATTMEEVFEGVTLGDVMRRLQPDFVVVGEATGLNINRGGRGRAELQLTTTGRPAHSSSPHLGRNAVKEMVRVIDAIERLALATDPLLGPAILALTDIISDPYPGYSVIPASCRATYDRRLLPGEQETDVISAIKELSELESIQLDVGIAQGEHTAYTGRTIRHAKFYPAWVISEDNPLVSRAQYGLHQIGQSPQIGAYRFCTNATHSAGHAGVPTIGYGPAEESDAHVVDERLQVADLFAAAAGYRSIIEAVLDSK
jgi:putative selenium metabolism hydrolase